MNGKMVSKKDRIHEAVLELLAKNYTISDVKMSAVAEIAGIGKGTIYEYFPSKDKMLYETIEYHIKTQISAFNDIVGEAGFRECVYDLIGAIVNNLDRNKVFIQYGLLQLISIPNCSNSDLKKKENALFSAVKTSTYDVIERLCLKGIDEGIVRANITQNDVVYSISATVSYLNFLNHEEIEREDLRVVQEFCYSQIIKILG